MPTSQPTQTPTPTITASLTPTQTPSPTQTPVPPTVIIRDWVFALGLALVSAALLVWIGMSFSVPRWALRWGLCTLIGGLLGFNFFALRFPGSQALLVTYGSSGILALTGLGSLAGALVGWVWQQITIRRQPPQRITGPSSQED